MFELLDRFDSNPLDFPKSNFFCFFLYWNFIRLCLRSLFSLKIDIREKKSVHFFKCSNSIKWLNLSQSYREQIIRIMIVKNIVDFNKSFFQKKISNYPTTKKIVLKNSNFNHCIDLHVRRQKYSSICFVLFFFN